MKMKKLLLTVAAVVFSGLVATACQPGNPDTSSANISATVFSGVLTTIAGQNGHGTAGIDEQRLYRNIAELSAKKQGLAKTVLTDVINHSGSVIRGGLKIADYRPTKSLTKAQRDALSRVNREIKSIRITESLTTKTGKRVKNGALHNGDKYVVTVKNTYSQGAFKEAAQHVVVSRLTR
ncbi:hypothetical protein [Schleiferilactobacillus harbinensis]|jgi:hypothetical protein|uniref:hypothetical protein n=1 Tax=Schleiferilactobacillus harbinensis TaxID=304207 RepID=UPI001238561D|nr:hypothetical protein [Schleiferilactobacillus harbinensis]MCI1687121.1 hypothetical protein [Schleiferilactobacillus harbinensis]MCI1850008.1 hypothetical protein [Schleiferilactobacillus harbinensis]QEU46645.1 hypothetical protein FMM01_04705 [Schleiferilactobacillus harbinensis]